MRGILSVGIIMHSPVRLTTRKFAVDRNVYASSVMYQSEEKDNTGSSHIDTLVVGGLGRRVRLIAARTNNNR